MKPRKPKKSKKEKLVGQLSIDFLNNANIHLSDKAMGKIISINIKKNKMEKSVIKYILEHTKSF